MRLQRVVKNGLSHLCPPLRLGAWEKLDRGGRSVQKSTIASVRVALFVGSTARMQLLLGERTIRRR